MKKQIKPNGEMPHEIKRTQSLFYHSFNAQAFIRLAYYAEKFDIDYYELESKKSGTIKDTVAPRFKPPLKRLIRWSLRAVIICSLVNNSRS